MLHLLCGGQQVPVYGGAVPGAHYVKANSIERAHSDAVAAVDAAFLLAFNCRGQGSELLYLDDARRALQDADAATIAFLVINPEYAHSSSFWRQISTHKLTI